MRYIKKFWKTNLKKLFNRAVEINHQNIMEMMVSNEKAKFLDLGCDDGKVTLKISKKIGTKHVYGVDIIDGNLNKAKKAGIVTYKIDLNKKFSPLKSNFFDVVHSNQVIEHLTNSDNFLTEINRILKPGGYCVISTENASSWVNIMASILGWQIFSLANFSNFQESIGNPLSLHQGKVQGNSAWNHVRIYNYRGLKDYFKAAGFTDVEVIGAGYFPLPAVIGKLDPIHAHFITVRAKKQLI